MKKLSRPLSLFIIAATLAALLMVPGCGRTKYNPLEGVETTTITDSCGRDVEVPAEITAIAGSGSVAQMILMSIAPDLLVGLASSPSRAQREYFPDYTWYLPTFGQFYGSKSTLNQEALIEAKPQIIIDLGDRKIGHAADMGMIQRQTGIPTIFIEADIDDLPDAYRTLGRLLNREERGEELASYIENTVAFAQSCAAQIPEAERKTVYYGTGASGLACNAAGSSQADVIDMVGGVNAIVTKEIINTGGGTTVSLEQLYTVQPDVIVLSDIGPYDTLADSEWSGLVAVQNDCCYKIPCEPYDWMSSPPSVNRVLGVWWLGQLLYPDLYDYDMADKAIEYYKLFYGYDLSREQAEEWLQCSTLKAGAGS